MRKVYVVGIGSGAYGQMTLQAERVLREAEVIIGYTVYVDMVRVHFPDKEFFSTPMAREAERCRIAFEQAASGRRAALICGGDPGIYGMSGWMLEIAREYPRVEVETVPGVTAASGGAALLGAPLGHDFAVISLSDLLTPWERIERRVLAAAESDLVICLYNPSSKKRRDHLKKACDLILRHQAGETVCAVAARIGREGEKTEVLTLRKLRDRQTDMSTTVFVGNSRTRLIDGKMVTPRREEGDARQDGEGKVYFVGAGSGAPDLITLRGQRLLRRADVIIYAGSLVNPALLEGKKPDCDIYDSSGMTLEEMVEVMRVAVADGRMTVRLHTGDPSVYSAIREQMDALDQSGISYEVCPGVSSFGAAASALNLEYTLPGVSQSVVITRMAGRTSVPDCESIASFAAHHATMVIFLSAGLLPQLAEQLMEGGYLPDTPAAIVYRASWPEERSFVCTVDTLAQTAKEHGITKTALIIVGNIVAHGDYRRSKLYHPGFCTEFREAKK